MNWRSEISRPTVVWPVLLAGLVIAPIAGWCFGVAKAVFW